MDLTAWGRWSPRLGSLIGLWKNPNWHIGGQAGHPNRSVAHSTRGLAAASHYGEVPLYLRSG